MPPIVQLPRIGEFTSAATGLAKLAQVASRPRFELGFNVLQNQVISRLNKEIEKVNKEDAAAGATALFEVTQKKLERELEQLNAYIDRAKKNRGRAADVHATLEQMQPLASQTDAASVAEFDRLRDLANGQMQMLISTPYEVFGTPDGIGRLKAEANPSGILYHADYATAGERADAVGDYVGDGAGAVNIAEGALGNIARLEYTIYLNGERAADKKLAIESKLSEISRDVERVKIASKLELLEQVKQLRQKAAAQLQSLSFAFESQQAASDQLRARLDVQQAQPGSVLNLFT